VGSDDKPILERIERVLSELSRSIGVAEDNHEQAHVGRAVSTQIEHHISRTDHMRLTAALAWIRARQARDMALGDDLFFDPAWSILLELYVHYRQRTSASVTSLCAAARVPSSTGLRWVALLERRGLVSREADPFDRRKIYAQLTPVAVKQIDDSLDAAAQASDQLGLRFESVRRAN
jgi:DNA-binding MarR family transcriptional regulator